VGVVDHAGLAGTVHVAQGLGEEDLALEAAELWVQLEEEHPGVGEHEAGRLHAPDRAAEVKVVGGGVVLHLLARREVVVPDRLLGYLADSVAAAEGGQGRIGELEPGLGQLLVHPHETALALAEEPQDVLAVLEGLLGACEPRHLGRALPQDLAHGGAGHLERTRDRAHALPAVVQLKDRVPDRLRQHGRPPLAAGRPAGPSPRGRRPRAGALPRVRAGAGAGNTP
jgi:hypothetical protein